MSLYRIALAVFLIGFGLVLVFGLGRTAEVVAGIGALVAGALVLVDSDNTATTR